MSPHATGRSAALAILLAVLCAGLAACGLSNESAPRAITDAEVTDLGSPPPGATTPASGARIAHLVFVEGEDLVSVPVATDDDSPDGVLSLLLDGPARSDLTTSIPAGTVVRDASWADRVLTIDLSGAIEEIGGSAAKTAYAQLVFTALGTRDVDRVRFEIDGDAVDAPTDDGALPVVSERNYDTEPVPAR